MAKFLRKTRNKQSGQILVHLAEIFVSAGLVVGVAMQGNVYLEKLEYVNAYKDLKQVENSVWSYYEAKGHWPKECGAISQKAMDESSGGSDSLCYATRDKLVDKLSAGIATNAGLGEWDRSFSIETVKVSQGFQKHAIIMNGVTPTLAQWLDQKIDGNSSLSGGRIISLNTSQDRSKYNVAYLFESQIH